jgi:hypothetical protein
MYDIHDLRATVVPKSDQLNAEQLLSGPITITVTDIKIGSSEEQPVIIHYQDDAGRPYKPCKTCRKILIVAWGEDGTQWIGRSMTLYNEQSVKFGGMEVGGIRISHLSDIPRDLQVSLTSTKGKKSAHFIRRMGTEEKKEYIALEPVLDKITAAQTTDDLEKLRPELRKLSPDDKKQATQAAVARANEIRAKAAGADPQTGEIKQPQGEI